MPSFTAVALDSLLERKEQKNVSRPPPAPRKLEVGGSSRQKSVLPRYPSPALYATPKPASLPDSPTSFSPSPYVINHKRRGPRLQKSHSESEVLQAHTLSEEVGVAENGMPLSDEQIVDCADDASAISELRNSQGKSSLPHLHKSPKSPMVSISPIGNGSKGASKVWGSDEDSSVNGFRKDIDAGNVLSCINTSPARPEIVDFEKDSDCDDFFDPQDSLSVASFSDSDGISAADRSLKKVAQGEFFDACEDLSSDGSISRNTEIEILEMRLNLLSEIEKRKQAEESVQNMQNRWQEMQQKLALVGLVLPPLMPTVKDGELNDSDPAEDVCQQVHLARLVAAAIGRGSAKAEMEAEMENQISAKNFEIARLGDRLQYCEAVNREMSQRNQEAAEITRRQRQDRKRREMWLWGSVGTTVLLGSAALAWFFLPGEGTEKAPPLESSGDHSA